MANKVNKKSRKRERLLENIKKAHKKKKKAKTVESFNFSALHLIHDPQNFAEKLFKRLDQLKEKFEVKLMFLDLVSAVKRYLLGRTRTLGTCSFERTSQT
jgi:protein SDA1